MPSTIQIPNMFGTPLEFPNLSLADAAMPLMTAIKLCMDHNLTFLYALVTLQIAHIQVPALNILSYLVTWL